MQKVLIFDYYNGKLYDNVQELNKFLANGWKVISQAAAANDNHIILSYVVEFDQDLAGQETNTTTNNSL